MNADAYFSIGKSHVVCQDYARVGTATQNQRLYAIVSDGCSSSPDTDFGARFLSLAAIQGLHTFGDALNQHGEWMIWRARESVRLLSSRCLDATLLTLHEQESGDVQANAWGDGLIFGLTHEGVLHVWEIDMQGAPGYLSYLLDLNRLHLYNQEGFGKRIIRFWVQGVLQTEEVSVFETTYGLGLGYKNDAFTTTFSPSVYRYVGVSTDGAQSFFNPDTLAPIPYQDVLKHMTNIPVPVGKFVERSSKFFLQKICPKLGWQHADDYGVAMIHLGEPKS